MKPLILMILFSAAPTSASTTEREPATCPVCLAQNFVLVQLSASIFDSGLDFQDLGAVISPRPLGSCGECGFIITGSTASARKLDSWRALALTKEYAALSRRGSYYKLAYIHKKLGDRKALDLAHLYLKASWQERRHPGEEREDLELALENFTAALTGLEFGSRDWATAQYFRAEVLRRLSRFREARLALAALRSRRVSKPGVLAEAIKYQRVLCLRRDPQPRGMEEMRSEGFLDAVKDYFRLPF